MNEKHPSNNWHILVDKFVWSDENALSLVSDEISDEEIQRYLYTYHGDYMLVEEFKKMWSCGVAM